MMQYGKGIPKDRKGGVAWILKAAKQGNAFAERDLGICYMQGEGVPKSDKDALAWLYSAAVQDETTAECNLAFLYRNGRGVARDYKAAYAWYYRAAQRNDHHGEMGMGYLYLRGYGIKKDIGEALKWYRKAEAGLPEDKTIQKIITLANFQAFIESPDTKSLNLDSIRANFLSAAHRRALSDGVDLCRHRGHPPLL